MKKWTLSTLLFLFFVSFGYSQDTIIRIGSSYLTIDKRTIDKGLKPIFVYDGVPFESVEDLNKIINTDVIDSIYVRKDSVADYRGKVKFYGVIEIYSKDTIHPGLKQILIKTDYWLYKYPFTLLKINGKVVKWNKRTANRLFDLKAENIIDVEIIDSKNSTHQANGLLKLTIDE
jgi:hypothetical protein